MVCPNCGINLSGDENFCPNCGINLKLYAQQESTPHHQLDLITNWISNNGMLVFIGALIILILTSGSAMLGISALVVGLILIYFLAVNSQAGQITDLNNKLINRIDLVGSKVVTGLEQHTAIDKNASVHQEKVRNRTGNINFNWISIFIALASLIIVFYGPFASRLFGIDAPSYSIFRSMIMFAKDYPQYAYLGFGLLVIVILVPVLIVILTLANGKHTNMWAFIASLIELLALLFVLVQVLRGSAMTQGLSQFGISNANPHIEVTKEIIGMRIGFGISSYLLLLSTVLSTISTWINRR